MRLIKYVEILWQLGLVVVAAAGNNGPDIGSITVPGVSKKIITGWCSRGWEKSKCKWEIHIELFWKRSNM